MQKSATDTSQKQVCWQIRGKLFKVTPRAVATPHGGGAAMYFPSTIAPRILNSPRAGYLAFGSWLPSSRHLASVFRPSLSDRWCNFATTKELKLGR